MSKVEVKLETNCPSPLHFNELPMYSLFSYGGVLYMKHHGGYGIPLSAGKSKGFAGDCDVYEVDVQIQFKLI